MKKFGARIALLVMAIAITDLANAQKLPGKQEGGLRAPANMKTDGKLTEWDGKLQAYNNATEFAYTISNDDDKLYLTIQCKLRDVVDKILRGGISLTVNHIIKKNDPQAVTISYPALKGEDMNAVTNMFARATNQKREAGNGPVPVDDLNNLFQSRAKTIGVKGIKDVNDPAISVYNEEGIKAAALFDTGLTYTYELAIPLKYLDLPKDAAFAYHLKINAPDESPVSHAGGPPPPPMMVTSTAPTDFWGEYTLAKK